MLVSNSMVSSKMSIVLFLVVKRRPGRRESPVTRDRNRKAGRSAYMEQLESGGALVSLRLISCRRCRTSSNIETPCQPLIKELGWKTTDQLITCETNIIVYKSLLELALNICVICSPEHPS